MEPCSIVDDPREIDSVWYIAEGGGGWSVSIQGYDCTAIVAYTENGHMAALPWIAVYRGEEIVVRIPAGAVTINYKVPSP